MLKLRWHASDVCVSVCVCVSVPLRLQASMTALLQYYTRMLELLKRQGPDGAAVVKDAVNVPAIMYEIKRITKAP